MILVLDTNVLLSHAELDGRDWDEVKTAVADGVLTVVTPHVVADELTARVRTNRLATKPVRPERKGFHRAPHHISDPVDAAYATANEQIDQWAAGYDAARVFVEAGFIVRPAPEARHEDLGYRAANRIRPFDANGNGYRDTLHWYTVLELLQENQGEHIVLLSDDSKAYWEAEHLHPHLAGEVAPLLVNGTTFTLARALPDISIPSKYSDVEESVTLTDAERDELVEELFKAGTLHSTELWEKLPPVSELGDPVPAEISEPENPSVVFAFARQLAAGGTAYQTRVRLNARIVFDWVDWIVDLEDDGTRADLDITTWYVRDDTGICIDVARTDVQPARVETPPLASTSSGPRSNSFTWQLFENLRMSEIKIQPGAVKYTADLLREIGHLSVAEMTRTRFTADALADIIRPTITPEALANIARSTITPEALASVKGAALNAEALTGMKGAAFSAEALANLKSQSISRELLSNSAIANPLADSTGRLARRPAASTAPPSLQPLPDTDSTESTGSADDDQDEKDK